jgi:hypothetical protein
VRASSAEIEGEFDEIAWEVGRLAARLQRLDLGEILKAGSQEEWEASTACSSAIEKIYTGCERIMTVLETGDDGRKVVRECNWHRALLDRMKQPRDGAPPVITEGTFDRLDRMPAFRHRERNSYGHATI